MTLLPIPKQLSLCHTVTFFRINYALNYEHNITVDRFKSTISIIISNLNSCILKISLSPTCQQHILKNVSFLYREKNIIWAISPHVNAIDKLNRVSSFRIKPFKSELINFNVYSACVLAPSKCCCCC